MMLQAILVMAATLAACGVAWEVGMRFGGYRRQRDGAEASLS